jgi:hypothetical protein
MKEGVEKLARAKLQQPRLCNSLPVKATVVVQEMVNASGAQDGVRLTASCLAVCEDCLLETLADAGDQLLKTERREGSSVVV